MKTVIENKDTNINTSENMKRLLKGIILSFILTLVLLFVFSIFLTYTSLSESTIVPVITIITIVSILIGSSIGTIRLNKNGLLNGGMVGLIYILFIYLLSSIVGTGFSFNLNSIIIIILSVLAGAVGGIIGVNMK